MKSHISVFYYANLVDISQFNFSAGETQVRVDPKLNIVQSSDEPFLINAFIYDAEGLIALSLICDALNRSYPLVSKWLYMPYLPYSRQDRACAPGEASSLYVIADILNRLPVAKFFTYDVHSYKATQEVTKLTNITAEKFVARIPNVMKKYTHVVSTDKGGLDRAKLVASMLGLPLIMGEKVRDPNDGKITGTKAYHISYHNGAEVKSEMKNFNHGAKLLMVDDICDGGRTFLELAYYLRPFLYSPSGQDGTIDLYVTHAIMSKGMEQLDKEFGQVYTAHLFPNEYDVSSVVNLSSGAVGWK